MTDFQKRSERQMKKRFLSALLAAALALTLLPTALAATAAEDASQVLAALDIMVGDENGSLNLSAPVTRAEFVKMLMAASPVSVGDETAVSPYPDVPRTHWAAPYVEAAVRAGYVTGYLDGTFRPSNTITLSEGHLQPGAVLRPDGTGTGGTGASDPDAGGLYPARCGASGHKRRFVRTAESGCGHAEGAASWKKGSDTCN